MLNGKKLLIFLLFIFFTSNQIFGTEKLNNLWDNTPSWVKYSVAAVVGGYVLWDLRKKNNKIVQLKHDFKGIKKDKHNPLSDISSIDASVGIFEGFSDYSSKEKGYEKDLNFPWTYIIASEKIVAAQKRRSNKSWNHPRSHNDTDDSFANLILNLIVEGRKGKKNEEMSTAHFLSQSV